MVAATHRIRSLKGLRNYLAAFVITHLGRYPLASVAFKSFRRNETTFRRAMESTGRVRLSTQRGQSRLPRNGRKLAWPLPSSVDLGETAPEISARCSVAAPATGAACPESDAPGPANAAGPAEDRGWSARPRRSRAEVVLRMPARPVPGDPHSLGQSPPMRLLEVDRLKVSGLRPGA